MRVTVISLLFPPETGSARRVGELAAFLGRQGHQVSVITGFPSYPRGVVHEGFKKRLVQRSRWKDVVDLYRVFLYTSSKKDRFFHRLLHYLSFTVSSAVCGLLIRRPDVVLVVSPPYFLGCSGWLIKALRGARLAFDVQDFWPEAPIALGYVHSPVLIKALIAVERFIYRKSDVVLALSEVMKRKIEARGVPGCKVKHVYNWVDLQMFAPVPGDSHRRRLGLTERFVFLFAGNMGTAQGLETVIEAAALLKEEPGLVFALLGDGILRESLMERSRELGLENVLFLDSVAEDEVPSYFGMADVLLVTLGRAKHREAAIPSKIQAYMASAKPILAAAEGAAAREVEDAGCGVVVEPDDPEALAKGALTLVRRSGEERRALGRRSHDHAQRHFDQVVQCSLIETHLTCAVQGNDSSG